MDTLIAATVLGLSVSADALACGFAAGAARMRIPLISALAAAFVSAAFVAFGFFAGNMSAPLLPGAVQRYISFGVLAVFGLVRLAGAGDKSPFPDFNSDKILSVGEALALGSSISIDGLAAGFGAMGTLPAAVCATLTTFACTTLSLYFGAKCGRMTKGGRLSNTVAALALIILAVQKLLNG